MTVNPQTQVTGASSHIWLARRVACRTCGGTRLDYVEQNRLECSDCHTKQWSVLNMHEGLDSSQQLDSPTILKRLFIRLGFPQTAFIKYVPRATQFFWFRCMKCKKISADYVHGYSRYFTCEFCKSTVKST